MKKTILILGVICLFVGAAVNPIVFGFNIKTSNDTPIIKMDIPGIPPYQGPSNEIWNKTYINWSGYDEFNNFQQTSDGGYVFIGGTWTYHNWDGVILKTDKDGEVEFREVIIGTLEDEEGLECIRETADNGFIMVGHSWNYTTDISYVWLVKTDENGSILWDKKYESPVQVALGRYILVLDDGFLIMARIWDTPSIWLIKTDFDGNEIWNKRIGSADESPDSIIQTKNGDFVILGFDCPGTVWYTILIKLDSNFNLIWRKSYAGYGACDFVEVEDGGYIVLAHKSEKPILIKFSSDGDILWSKQYSFPHYWCTSLTQTSDGGFIFVGWASGLIPGDNSAVIIKTDSYGNKIWEKIYPVGEYRFAADRVLESDDGNYVIMGHTAEYWPDDGIYGPDILWLVKLSPFENQRPIKPSRPNRQNIGKPLVSFTFNTSSYDPDGDILYYTWSWGNGKYTYWVGPHSNNETCQIKYNTWLFPGTYNIKVKATDIYGGESDWSDPFTITVSRDKAVSNSLFLRFLEYFPLLYRLLDIWRLNLV